MRIILVRHGITEYNRERRYQGHVDIPLSDEGKAMLSASDIRPDAVYVSPLERARETAGIIFPGASVYPVQNLIEMDFGVFDGRTADEMADDAEYTHWVNGMCEGRCPGGESKPEFESRTCKAFLDIVADAQENSTIAIVAHGGTQMALMSRYADREVEYWKWQTKPGCGYVMEWDGSRLTGIDRVEFTGGDTCR